jgi:hypothetical protein
LADIVGRQLKRTEAAGDRQVGLDGDRVVGLKANSCTGESPSERDKRATEEWRLSAQRFDCARQRSRWRARNDQDPGESVVGTGLDVRPDVFRSFLEEESGPTQELDLKLPHHGLRVRPSTSGCDMGQRLQADFRRSQKDDLQIVG